MQLKLGSIELIVPLAANFSDVSQSSELLLNSLEIVCQFHGVWRGIS